MDTIDYIKTNDYIIKVCNVICSNEGYYGSINKDDNFSMSIGALQWHGCRAKKLLKLIVSKNEKQARAILSETTIFNDLTKDDDYWNKKIANSIEAEKLSRLLITSTGIQAQNELLVIDVNNYIQHGISLGITDPQVLAYFADLENQGGPITAERITKDSGIANNLTLNDIHKAALLDPVLGLNKARRNMTFTRIMITLP